MLKASIAYHNDALWKRAEHAVRTTVTLDEDVVAKLRDRMNRSGTTFKETLNVCLRRGLEQPTDEDLARPFTVEARSMGRRAGIDLDDIGGLLDLLDGPTYS